MAQVTICTYYPAGKTLNDGGSPGERMNDHRARALAIAAGTLLGSAVIHAQQTAQIDFESVGRGAPMLDDINERVGAHLGEVLGAGNGEARERGHLQLRELRG